MKQMVVVCGSLARMHTMTDRSEALLAGDEEFLRALVRKALQEVLEVEMTQALGAEKGERTTDRLGYRSGYYRRTLVTRIGKLELRLRHRPSFRALQMGHEMAASHIDLTLFGQPPLDTRG
jgi:transposase-like protein